MVNFSLEGKVTLVTGASYGIGFALATAFEMCIRDRRYTLLMMAAAILIWVNIRKLSRPNIRLYFSAFLLGLGLLIGAWKVGAFYLYSEHVLLRHIYLEILFHFGWFSVLISSILPIFFVKQKNAKLDRGSKIGLLIVVLLFDFTIAMPNIFGDEIMEARIYGNENCYLIQNGEEWSCHLLSVTNPDDKIWTDSVVMRCLLYTSYFIKALDMQKPHRKIIERDKQDKEDFSGFAF